MSGARALVVLGSILAALGAALILAWARSLLGPPPADWSALLAGSSILPSGLLLVALGTRR